MPFRERGSVRMGEIVEWLGLSKITISRMKSRGTFPKHDFAIGRAILWYPATVVRWLESQKGP